ncbi:hypothetical protein U9M48_031618 [Paspalum notatum var. saurae]|uniref:Uncharacterized protein n=1 Tax=Paspalum notatum var. saurae TaxID=547442 RepID=A0AAQ3X4W8_PASNO
MVEIALLEVYKEQNPSLLLECVRKGAAKHHPPQREKRGRKEEKALGENCSARRKHCSTRRNCSVQHHKCGSVFIQLVSRGSNVVRSAPNLDEGLIVVLKPFYPNSKNKKVDEELVKCCGLFLREYN